MHHVSLSKVKGKNEDSILFLIDYIHGRLVAALVLSHVCIDRYKGIKQSIVYSAVKVLNQVA